MEMFPYIILIINIQKIVLQNGKFDISDHLMGHKNFEYKVASIEDIIDIIDMHAKKMLNEYIEMDKPNYFNFRFPLNY